MTAPTVPGPSVSLPPAARGAEPAAAELEVWIAARTEPFSATDALSAFANAEIAPESLVRLLRAHPAVAYAEGRYFTARILAASTRFLVRLTPFEREQGLLILGHRFLPLLTPAQGLEAIGLCGPDGTPLVCERVAIPRPLAEMCHKLLGPAHRGARMGEGDPVTLTVVRLPVALLAEEICVSCLDATTRVFSLERFDEPSLEQRRVLDARLLAGLRQCVKEPPPGPATACRQMLHAVAGVAGQLGRRPLSPLAPLVGTAPDLRVSIVDGEARLIQSETASLPAIGRTVSAGTMAADSAAVPPREVAAAEWKSVFSRLDGLLDASSGVLEDANVAVQRLAWLVRPEPPAPALTPVLQRQHKPGEWTIGKRLSAAEVERGGEPWIHPADQAAARSILQATASPWGAATTGLAFDMFAVLEKLVRHPHVHWENGPDLPVRIEAEDLRLHVEVGTSGAIGLLPAAGGLIAGRGASASLFHQGLVLVDREGGRIVLARATPLAVTLMQELRFGARVLPPEAAEELLSRIPLLAGVLPVDLPAALQGTECESDRRIVLRLTPQKDAGLRVALRVRPLPNNTCLFRPGEGPSEVRATIAERRLFARRNLSDEIERARVQRDTLGLARYPEFVPWEWRIGDDEAALEFIEALRPRPREGLVLEWPSGVDGLPAVVDASPDRMKAKVVEEEDGFGLDGGVEAEGVIVSLARILDSLRHGRRYVPIGDGRWLRITQFLSERLAALSQVVQPVRGKLRIDRSVAPLAAEALRETGTLDACEAWTGLLARFQGAMSQAPELPADFRAELRPYQMEGFRWMCRLADWGVGGCLADDMGLGKTVQTLAVVAHRSKSGPTLILAPTSVESNWARECARFCPSLRLTRWRSSGRMGGRQAFGPGDVVIASYGLVLRDVNRLASIQWKTLIFDEAQALKNSHTRTAQAVRAIAGEWRLALTGTPIENRLGDLWGLFRAVCPGLLGSWEFFSERFGIPITRDQDESRRTALVRLLRPFLLRRTKAEVLKDLPPRTEVNLEVELSAEERELYEAARLKTVDRLVHLRDLTEQDGRFQALTALTELRQLACHPRLVYPDLQIESAKLRLFLETIEELTDEGHRALVFSQFTRHLALVRKELDQRGVSYKYLDGQTPPRQREEQVAAFQRGEGSLFLISLKAGGTGLNLTGADYVIHLDPWWNPAVEDQATDRAHRMGQKRPVMVYRLVTMGTIEERILGVHADKRDLVTALMEGTDQAARLSVAEMLDLIQTNGPDADLPRDADDDREVE